RELAHVTRDIRPRRLRKAREGNDVLVGHEAEGEVDAAGAKAGDPGRQVELRVPRDPLHAMQHAILIEGSTEELERAVLEPLGEQGGRGLSDALPLDELEERPLSERQRRDRAGLEVPVLAHPSGIELAAVLTPAPVEVHETGVQAVAARNVRWRKETANARLDIPEELCHHSRERLCFHAAVPDLPRRPVVVETGKLPAS